jgi:hypothetical protein
VGATDRGQVLNSFSAVKERITGEAGLR